MSARQFVATRPGQAAAPLQWVVAQAAARIDISGLLFTMRGANEAGGWSDTPPITYEHGGAVTNAAIIIDGKRPIGARARRIAEPQLILALDGSDQVRLFLAPYLP